MKNWGDFFNQIRMLLESGQDSFRVEADDSLVNIVVDRSSKGEHGIIFSFDRISGKMFHVSAERNTLIEMYRALEELPGRIRRDATLQMIEAERNLMANGAERARVLVYTWLREANMIPHGGR